MLVIHMRPYRTYPIRTKNMILILLHLIIHYVISSICLSCSERTLELKRIHLHIYCPKDATSTFSMPLPRPPGTITRNQSSGFPKTRSGNISFNLPTPLTPQIFKGSKKTCNTRPCENFVSREPQCDSWSALQASAEVSFSTSNYKQSLAFHRF